MAAEFVTAIKRNRIPAGGLTAIDLGGTRVAVANIGDAYFAFEASTARRTCAVPCRSSRPGAQWISSGFRTKRSTCALCTSARRRAASWCPVTRHRRYSRSLPNAPPLASRT